MGGSLSGKLLEAVRPRGTMLVYGAMSGQSFILAIPDVMFQLKVRAPAAATCPTPALSTAAAEHQVGAGSSAPLWCFLLASGAVHLQVVTGFHCR